MKHITNVPKSPDYIKGVINLRGNVLPVVDLRIKFGMPEITITKDTCILVLQIELEGENVMLGALVDSVKAVLEINEDNMESSPSIGSKYKVEFIKGMWRVDESFIMILNIDLIFSSEEFLLLNESKEMEVAEELETE